MPRGRKPSPEACKRADKRYCFACRREIVWVHDFYWDPVFSPYPHHKTCAERAARKLSSLEVPMLAVPAYTGHIGITVNPFRKKRAARLQT